MPTEIEQAVQRARQQSDVFMQQSRAQMYQVHQEQRAVMMGGAPQQGGGMSQYPQMGTPAGRLMDTITTLVRQGARTGGGGIAPIGQALGGAGAAGGGGLGFMMGDSPFGAGGVEGGAGAQRGLGFWQSMFTAYGQGLPFGLGKYAGQRLDMTQRQAQTLAREEMSYRLRGGLRVGAYDALNALSFGVFGMRMRRSGQEFETRDLEYFTRRTQEQLRFMRPEAIREAGLGEEDVGAFGAGLTRTGARRYARQVARQMGGMQAERGITREEATGLWRAGAMMEGGVAMERLAARGPEAYGRGVRRMAENVREIRQTLNIAEDEFEQFFSTLGQASGTSDRVAQMARTAVTRARRLGMGRREVFNMMTQFETMGRQMGTGQVMTGQAMMGQVEMMRDWERQGMFPREELFRYSQPGATAQQALQDQARVRYQQNINMWQRGGLRGVGMMATQAPGVFERFMGGGMGYMGMMGAIGGQMAADPLSRIRSLYDPRQYRMMGRMGARVAYQTVQAMRQQGMFGMFGSPEQQRLMALHRFSQQSGLQPLEARQRYEQFERERSIFAYESRRRYGEGAPQTPDQYAGEMGRIHNQILAQDASEVAMQITGAGSPMEAAEVMHDRLTNGGKDRLPANMRIEDMLQNAGDKMGRPVEAGQFKGFFDPFTNQLAGASYMGRLGRERALEVMQFAAPRALAAGRAEVIFGDRRGTALGEIATDYGRRGFMGEGREADIRFARERVRAGWERTFGVGRIQGLGREMGRRGVTARGFRRMIFGRRGGVSVSRSVGLGILEPEFRTGEVTMNQQRQLVLRQGTDESVLNWGDLETKFGKDEADRVRSVMANRIGRLGNQRHLSTLLTSLREEGELEDPGTAAYREWIDARAMREFRGIFSGYENLNVKEVLAGIAGLDDRARGQMGEAFVKSFGTQFRTSPLYARFAGFQREVEVSQWRTKAPTLHWRKVDTLQERAEQIRRTLGVEQGALAASMARIFKQADIGWAGVEGKAWTPELMQERLKEGAVTAEQQKKLLEITKWATPFGNILETELKKGVEKEAKAEFMPVRIRESDINVLAEKIGKAVKP